MKPFERPPFNLCAQCGAALISPIWAEHLNERHVRNLWSCETCGYQFETSAYFPAPELAREQAQASGTNARVH
jgi:ribosomal protein L37AE/L43A